MTTAKAEPHMAQTGNEYSPGPQIQYDESWMTEPYLDSQRALASVDGINITMFTLVIV
jgi:hypothetical protein